MTENTFDDWSPARVTQIGEVYRVVVPLPVLVGGRRMEVRIRGIGIDAKASLRVADDDAGAPTAEPAP